MLRALCSHAIVRASIELLTDAVLYVGVLLLVIMLLGRRSGSPSE